MNLTELYSFGVWEGDYLVTGCHQHIISSNDHALFAWAILPPLCMEIEGMGFRIMQGIYDILNSSPLLLWSDHFIDPVLLSKLPTGFTLLCPHQYPEFLSQDYFFFQDALKTFFVVPPYDKISQFTPPLSNTPSDIIALNMPASYYSAPPEAHISPPPIQVLIPSPASASQTNNSLLNVTLNTPRQGAAASGMAFRPADILNQTMTQMTPFDRLNRRRLYTFLPFYHHYVCSFMSAVQGAGVDGLLKWPYPSNANASWSTPPDPMPLQMQTNDFFTNLYNPIYEVSKPYPDDDVDFDADGAYSQYNWELFFHIPLLIAQNLSRNQQFASARDWLHYIFDPTSLYPVPPPGTASAFPYGFWKVKPFYELTSESSIQQLIDLLDSTSPNNPSLQNKLIKLVQEWKKKPFDPFLIGRFRNSAFQKTVVMKYLDNLIAWGDSLFRQNTRESINQADQLYIMAEQLLGPHPQETPRGDAAPLAYKDIAAQFASTDDFSDPVINIENALPAPQGPGMPSLSLPYAPNPLATALYFCVPDNDKLLSYWDTIADRLFKIRNCMNIDGVVEQLALFSPPIPPGMLVQAAASGSLAAAISGLGAPAPIYRFSFIIKVAKEFCKQVQALGAKLLKALERDDAEALALIRATDEVTLQQAIRQEMIFRVQEAQTQLEELKRASQRLTDRFNWYSQNSQSALNTLEEVALGFEAGGDIVKAIAMAFHTTAGVSFIIPNVSIGVTGFGGSPTATASIGGGTFGKSAHAFGTAASVAAELLKDSAKIMMEIDKFQVRQSEWQREALLSQDQINEINKQMDVQQVKISLAGQQLDDHDQKTRNDQDVMNFLANKFTNQQLYDWLIDQISGVYFQGYQTAMQMALYSQGCFKRELPDFPNPSFIQSNYWNSLEQGLLSGETLMTDLMQMEAAYLNYNSRQFELARPISLKTLDPVAFNSLVTSGTCQFHIPQNFFDTDYPDHYLRIIKYVSLTFSLSKTLISPPLTINATLSLHSSSMKDKTGAYSITPNIQGSMCTSTGQKDIGVFETTLHYILTDDRYLFFEGAGAEDSRWTLDVKTANNPQLLDLSGHLLIDDVTLTVNYTSRV